MATPVACQPLLDWIAKAIVIDARSLVDQVLQQDPGADYFAAVPLGKAVKAHLYV